MPKRRKGPVNNRQTGYHFFDEYTGFKPDKKKSRFFSGAKILPEPNGYGSTKKAIEILGEKTKTGD